MALAAGECGGVVALQGQVPEAGGLGMFTVCDACGHERRVENFTECMVCAVKSEYLALTLEHRELREEVRRLGKEKSELREEVKGLREAVEMIRQDMSVRPKDRCERSSETWPVVGERRKSSQAGRGDSDRCQTGKEESNRSQERREGGDGQVWQVVKGGKPGGVLLRKVRSEPVECTNRFSLLEVEKDRREDEVTVVKDTRGKGVVDRERESVSSTPQVCVVGDSQVRYLDGSTFCAKNRGRRMNVCMPGAGVKAVSEEVQRRVHGMEREGVVVLHVGGNDVGARRSQEIVKRFKEDMLPKIRESGKRCVVSGILPRVYVGGEWLSRAIGVNEQLKDLCKKAGVSFVDEWSTFYGRRELYALDGVHLSRRGVEVLSKCLERGVGIECRG